MAKVTPMKCALNKTAENNPMYKHQRKIHGSRLVIDRGFLLTRHSDVPVNYKYPELLEQLEEFFPEYKSSRIDGEVAGLDENGIPRLGLINKRNMKDEFKIKLQSQLNPITWFVFDITVFNGKDIRDVRLDERAINKDSYLLSNAGETENIKILKWYDDGEKLFKDYTLKGGEGIVSKKIDSPYIDNYEGEYWTKTKRQVDSVPCTIIGVTHKNSLILMKNGFYHGKVYPINGQPSIYPSWLAHRLEQFKIPDVSIDVPEKICNEAKFWVNPIITVEVTFFEENVNPVFERLRLEDSNIIL